MVTTFISPKLNPISQPTLTLPTKKGGLGVCHIAHKSLAMRANQLNQLLQPHCKLPSTKFARHWMAKKIYFLKDWANFLSAYGPEPPETISQNKGYNSLISLFHNNQNIYISQKSSQVQNKFMPNYKRAYKDPKAAKPGNLNIFPPQRGKIVLKPLPSTTNKKNYGALGTINYTILKQKYVPNVVSGPHKNMFLQHVPSQKA